MKDVITAQDVQSVPPGGELSTGLGAIVTPWARTSSRVPASTRDSDGSAPLGEYSIAIVFLPLRMALRLFSRSRQPVYAMVRPGTRGKLPSSARWTRSTGSPVAGTR